LIAAHGSSGEAADVERQDKRVPKGFDAPPIGGGAGPVSV
jgi:hypothetical protein